MGSENIDLMYSDLCERLGVFIDDINYIINSYREFVELLIEHLHVLASTFESCFEILKDMLVKYLLWHTTEQIRNGFSTIYSTE